MKFNEVREVAPGVFFRYSAISATDLAVPFGGSNNIWILFDDYVLVIDANFPKEAADVIAAIRKTTDKPIRYVVDTHHHGDHAYGNAVFAAAGATIVAQANCAQEMRIDGPKEFREAGRGPTGRKDVAQSTLKVPNLIFDDKMVLDDGKRRVEIYFFGHAHTFGDAFAYLPHEKILCTGDACVNGAFNYLGQGDSASWIKVMERAQQLDAQLILPGHGPLAGKEACLKSRNTIFVDLRACCQALAENKPIADVISSIDMPWYKEWTGVNPTGENIRFVYAELTGRTKRWRFSTPPPSPWSGGSAWADQERSWMDETEAHCRAEPDARSLGRVETRCSRSRIHPGAHSRGCCHGCARRRRRDRILHRGHREGSSQTALDSQ